MNFINYPNFKNSLSESDKRVLAFAFFLSLLKHDEGLDKKILVFDDPFSSFEVRSKAIRLFHGKKVLRSRERPTGTLGRFFPVRRSWAI
jgi:wobble nucleotide-excising tRNase